MVVVLENDCYRANDEASCAREQPSRTFGFAMRFEAVLVPQVEAYRKDFVDRNFADTSLTFGSLPLALFVFVAASMCIGRSGLSSWRRG